MKTQSTSRGGRDKEEEAQVTHHGNQKTYIHTKVTKEIVTHQLSNLKNKKKKIL